MKAMILAAGRGARLRPLTDRTPKPMIPIAGRPLLEYVVRLLARHGFVDLCINLHHLPQIIRSHFGDGSSWGVHVTYSHEIELLGTAGAVRQMAGFFNEPFLVYYADNLCNVDLTEFWEGHRRSACAASMGLLWMDDPTHRGIVGLNGRSRLTRILEKPGAADVFDNYLVNGGLYALAPSVIERIPEQVPWDFSDQVFPALLAADTPVNGHRLRGRLLSTDTPARYRHACEQVASGSFVLP